MLLVPSFMEEQEEDVDHFGFDDMVEIAQGGSQLGTTRLHANFHSDMRSVSACFTQFQLPTKTASLSQQ